METEIDTTETQRPYSDLGFESQDSPETNAAYHADTSHVSSTVLKTMEQSPLLCLQTFITRELPYVDSDARRFGRLFHAMLLEPQSWQDVFIVMPKFELSPDNLTSGKKPVVSTSPNTDWCKARRREFIAAHTNREIVSEDDVALFHAMGKGILRNDLAREYLEARGIVETPFRWEDRIKRRCKLDKEFPAEGFILDFKTCTDASPLGFSRAASKDRMYVQHGFYREAMRVKHGREFRMVFAMVSKTPPHECGLYELGDFEVKQGVTDIDSWCHERVEELVEEYIDRTATGDWLHEWQQGITKVPLQNYVRSSFYEVTE